MKELPTDKLALEQGCYLDYTEAKRIRAFAKTHCGNDLLRWVYEEWITPLYSWKRKNGRLRFARNHVFVSKKASKTFTCAMLAVFTAITQKGSKVLLLAGKKEQCGELWDAIEVFRNHSPLLKARLWPRKDKDHFQDRETGSKITILSPIGEALSGHNFNLCIVDELLELPPHNATSCWHKLQDGGMARPNSLVITISTANYRKDVIGYDIYAKCKELLAGKSQDITVFPLLYEIDGDWRDENCWWPALPQVPELISKEWYREKFIAVKDDPVASAQFRVFNLNDWKCGSPQTWLPFGIVDACYEAFDFDQKFAGKPVSVGWDSAMSYDINSLCFAAQEGNKFYIKHLNFYPRESALKDTKHPYIQWATVKANNLHLLPGDTLKQSEVWSIVLNELRKFQVLGVYYDPTNFQSYRQLLEDHGYNAVSVNQRSGMPPCFKHLEQMFREGRIRHNGNDIFKHHLDNAVPKVNDHDELTITKLANDNRVDCVDSAAMSLAHWNQTTEPAWTPPPTGQRLIEIW